MWFVRNNVVSQDDDVVPLPVSFIHLFTCTDTTLFRSKGLYYQVGFNRIPDIKNEGTNSLNKNSRKSLISSEIKSRLNCVEYSVPGIPHRVFTEYIGK